MAKFNITLELDWINPDGENLDDILKGQIIHALVERLESRILQEASSHLLKNIEAVLQIKTETLINGLLEKPISVRKSWNETEEFPSIYAMVESRLSSLYMTKLSGEPSCKEDEVLKALKNHINSTLSAYETQIKKLIPTQGKAIAQQALKDSAFTQDLERVLGHQATQAREKL